ERESGLAGLSIAPLLFFPSTRDAYLAIGRTGDSVLVWRYTGAPERFADAAGELLSHCAGNGLKLNLLSTEPLAELTGTPMLATAFGVVQRLEDLASFTLAGGRRSKLRYLVKKFGRHGDNRVEEYVSGSDPATDAAIADLVDRWSEGKEMVNAYVAEARELIREGRLPDRNRIFLTYRDGRLLSAIVLAALPAENGYLLDVEFYPGDMPLGGLEYGLVEIIGRLAAEGVDVLSFGGSFGVEVTTTANPAQDVRQALAELRSVGIFDEGNYRFKKKFGPVEVPLYLCQPAPDPPPPPPPRRAPSAPPPATARGLAVRRRVPGPRRYRRGRRLCGRGGRRLGQRREGRLVQPGREQLVHRLGRVAGHVGGEGGGGHHAAPVHGRPVAQHADERGGAERAA
ncbi:phosphatidylglycerol lysyltransferase domain-containing protein, partial [Streptomyces goshikiensis]